jgi:hypothetical protein
MSPETPNLTSGTGSYLFRGDDSFTGGPLGRALGIEADGADIQNFADHVLRKESSRTSRYLSFTEEIKIARRFTSGVDNRFVVKLSWPVLREMECRGIIKVWIPDAVEAALLQAPKKIAKQANDVRTAMKRNREVLIEGQVPAGVVERAN